MHYRQPGMSKAFANLAVVDDFVKEGGFEDTVKEKKLKLVKDDLPEETRVVIMS
jgi:hypothetical protein